MKWNKCIRLEWYKMFHRRYFWIAFSLSLLTCLLSAWYQIDYYLLSKQELLDFEAIQVNSLYNSWIGGEYVSLGYTLFFYLSPLLSMLPYGWAYAEEKKSRYEKMIILKIGRKHYFFSKYLVNFISGGLVLLLPAVINILLVACFIPAITPDITEDIYYPVFANSMGAVWYFTYPFLHMLLYLVLYFIFGGLFACLAYSVSCFFANKLITLLGTYAVFLIWNEASTVLNSRTDSEFSILKFLHETDTEYHTNGWIVLLAILLLFFISGLKIWRTCAKYEDI